MKREEFEQLLTQLTIDYSTLNKDELSKVFEEAKGEIEFSNRPFGLMNTIYSSEAKKRGVTLEFYLVERTLIKAINQKNQNADLDSLKTEYAFFIENGLCKAREQKERKKLVDSMKENLSLSIYCKASKPAINKLFTWTTSKTFGTRKASVVDEIIEAHKKSVNDKDYLFSKHYSSGAVSARGSLRGATSLYVKVAMGVVMLFAQDDSVYRLEQDADLVALKLNEFEFDVELNETLIKYEEKLKLINVNVADF